MTDFQIRSVVEEDFIKIAELAKNCAPMAMERDSIYHIFTKFFQNTSFAAESLEREIIGFLLGFISQKNSNEAYIHLLCVKPEMRKKSLARSMIKNFFKVVGDKGCKKVSLITKPENKASIAFYKNLGFKMDKNHKTIETDGIKAVKDYNGHDKHMVVFYKVIDEL